MNRLIAIVLSVILLAFFGACGGTDHWRPDPTTRPATAGLSSVGVLPIPCAGPVWKGSAVDLMVADALTACSGDPATALSSKEFLPYGGGPMRDGYLTYIRGRMAETLEAQVTNGQVVSAWAAFRNDPEGTHTCDPVTHLPAPFAIKPKFIEEGVSHYSPTLGPLPTRRAYADLQLRNAAFSLCIAQTLREMVPGAASGAALLLSDADQRMLLETVRERSQMAMLDYAMLGVAFSTGYGAWGGTVASSVKRYIPDLQRWALTDGEGVDDQDQPIQPGYHESAVLTNMGEDFAASVQLHSAVSEELASLLSRSRSARTPRGGEADSRADEMWGAGSWHQRLLAAMLGGDPLANGTDSPWERPDPSVFPDDPKTYSRRFVFDRPGTPPAAATTDGWQWPAEDRAPFVRTSLSEPQVHELYRLARRLDRVLLRVSFGKGPGAGPWCGGYDLDGSAGDLYRWVEAELRREQCWAKDPNTGACCNTSTCTKQLLPTLPFPDESYLLWEQHRIRPEHAETLVSYLAENLDYRKLGLTPQLKGASTPYCKLVGTPNPDVRAGGQLLVGRVAFQEDPSSKHVWLRLSPPLQGIGAGPDAGFADRPLSDVAPAYSRNAILRFPAPWELAIFAPAQDQGFLGSCAHLPTDPQCPEPTLEAKRLMGSTAALAATRFMLVGSLGNLKSSASLPYEQARLKDYFAHAEEILRLVDGAIGSDSVAVRPMIDKPASGASVYVKTAADNSPLWQVAVTFSARDTTGFWADDAATYEVCALSHPAAGNLATQLATMPKLTIGTLVSDAEDAARCAGGLFWSDVSSEFASLPNAYDGAPAGWASTALALPTGNNKSFTFVAVRDGQSGEPADRTYRLLGTSVFTPRATYLQQGQYLASGGTLGELTRKSILGRPDNPTEHKYDGFGLPTDWVPPFNAELIGGTAGQTSVDRYLDLARSSADEATAAVNAAMDQLLQEQRDDQSMAAATERWQQGMREEQEKLCGTKNPDCTAEVSAPATLNPSWFPHYRAASLDGCDKTPAQGVASCREGFATCTTGCGDTFDQCRNQCASAPITTECQAACAADATVLQCLPGCWGDQACVQACIASCTVPCSVSACQDDCGTGKLTCYTGCELQSASCETASGQHQIDCFVARVEAATLGMELGIARPVLDKVSAPQQPAFNDYAGGSLQSAFIDQWSALRAIDTQLELLGQTADSTKQRLEVANSALRATWTTYLYQCDPARLQEAHLAGLSVGCAGAGRTYDIGSFAGSGGLHCSGDSASISYSPGPMIAQKASCKQADTAIPTEEALLVEAFLNALQSMGNATSGMGAAQEKLARSSATIAQLANDNRLAKARNDLEKKLAANGLTTSFGMYRRYRSYDVWRAKAWIENARRFALAARRAIDARYVVDLSNLSQPEAFVQSPSIWADDVYGYDLSLPAALGLTVTTGDQTSQPGAVYPNKIRDYVANLENFAMGYAVTRPAAISQQDVDVVNLRGLKVGDGVEVGGATIHGGPGEWSVRCPSDAGGEWIPIPRDIPAGQACDDQTASPDRARMLFLLDPWGRVNGSIADEPYERRYNGRWGLLAVNFVGTGIKNCDGAADPYACYSEGFIRYDLTHVGPASITDYDGRWHTLGVPIGRIEAAKGLASELWLDPLKDGWNTPYISAVARTEFQLRPLGGAYELEFEITPEIDIDKIDRVQLLIGSTYWVEQE